MQRILIGETPEKINKKVKVSGWIDTIRSHGNILFCDFRDISGVLQVVFNKNNKELYKKAEQIRPEWVVEITGKVGKRPTKMENPKLKTGKVELAAESLKIISEAKTPPISIDGDGYKISEEKRLEYRYIDLRRERLQKNLKTRQKVKDYIREFLKQRKFVEIETPILTKSTPEGARDFLVPSRLQPGKFYALPQSPQQYKQLLMVAGIERYFQFPRVFRDEDLRADRLFEHTQIDLEMSFTTEEGIRKLTEELVIKVTEEVLEKKIQQKPFPVITYKEAMEKYGEDDPDIRKNKKDKDLMAYCWIVDFPMFEEREDETIGAVHHPFTAIKKEHLDKLKQGKDKKDKSKYIGQIQAQQYDLVLNGREIFGGSIREYQPKILEQVFEFLGHSREEIQEKFGHLLKAFDYGVPPHGGIASGLDRWLQVLLNEKSIRETVTFPTTTSGKTAVMDAPSKVDEKQLKELNLKTIEKKKKKNKKE